MTTFFMSTWWGNFKNMEEIEFSRWLLEGKNVLPDGLNWLCYFAGKSKSHRENSISFMFLESPHQVDMKNIVKSCKHFLGYFNTLETHSDKSQRLHWVESWPRLLFYLFASSPSNQEMHCSTVIQLEMGLYCMEYALFRSEMQDSAQ